MTIHLPVLLNESLEALRAAEGGDFLDCTLGGGGHTRAILAANPQSTVTALDRDSRAVERSRAWAGSYGARLSIHHAPFSETAAIVAGQQFSGILADLGISSDQLGEGRGFSFNDDGALDMRMDESRGVSAADYLAKVSLSELTTILHEGGVGSDARRIAQAIVNDRPFATPRALAASISKVTKRKESGINPATVPFQAIRMAVNAELTEIEGLLTSLPQVARPGARLAVITFHSLEDAKVMKILRRWAHGEEFSASWGGTLPESTSAILGRIVAKKAITASEEELAANPRARSARLRVFEFSTEGAR